MNCKNCQTYLDENSHYCKNCGAKVILKRINFKNLLLEYIIVNFGVDSRFFITLRKLVTNPEIVINEYIGGVRKRYINPFAFLAIGAGLSLLIFNYFADDFIFVQDQVNQVQIEELKKAASIDISKINDLSTQEIQELKIKKKTAQLQLDILEGLWDFILRYFNLLTFVYLLLYAALSKWTFWKPHNYGEHIVINGYIYGFTTYTTLIAFFSAILIHPTIFTVSIFLSIIYYMYAFGRIYKLSLGKNLFKFFRFLVGLIIVVIISILLAGITSYLFNFWL